MRTFKRSADPAFAERVEDIVGLYMDPPRHAVVLSVNEKTQIQALERTWPDRPLPPGRPATRTHDYDCHGTTTLFATLNVLEGTVIGRCMQCHRHEEFLLFPNAVEGFFSAPSRRLLRRGTFTGIVDLQAAIKRHIAEHNQQPRPFVWTKPAALGFDFGTSRSSLRYVNAKDIRAYADRAADQTWMGLSVLREVLPCPTAYPLAHFLSETTPNQMDCRGLEALEAMLALIAYVAYAEHYTLGGAGGAMFKGFRQRSAVPHWGMFKRCASRTEPRWAFAHDLLPLADATNLAVLDHALS